MATTLLQIFNMALGKISGAGDQADGSAFITQAQLTAALAGSSSATKVTQWLVTLYEHIRRDLIIDLASRGIAFPETKRLKDMVLELKGNDLCISDITIGDSPTYTITVETESAHGYTTGDTIRLYGITGDGGIEVLNATYTITVVTTTTFTLDDTTGDSDYDYDEDSGYSSTLPEIGHWLYAFDLPSECIAVVRQTNGWPTDDNLYPFETIANIDDDGQLFLTNSLSNQTGDGAFIEYVIDQSTVTRMSSPFINCYTTWLAAELCPVVGKDIETRKRMLIEYDFICVPQALSYCGMQKNRLAKNKTDFLGGRRGAIMPLGGKTVFRVGPRGIQGDQGEQGVGIPECTE